MTTEEETLKRNLTVVGKISPYFAETLKNYDISDPDSEKLLEYCTWEDFNKKNSYHNCIKKDSDYFYSIEKNYTLDDLKKAIKTFTLSLDAQIYIYTHWMYFSFSLEIMRNMKTGLSIKFNCPINHKYYDLIKDAILNKKIKLKKFKKENEEISELKEKNIQKDILIEK